MICCICLSVCLCLRIIWFAAAETKQTKRESQLSHSSFFVPISLHLSVFLPAQRSSLYIFTHLNPIRTDQTRPGQTRPDQNKTEHQNQIELDYYEKISLPLYVYLPAQRSSLYIFTHLNPIRTDQTRPGQTRPDQNKTEHQNQIELDYYEKISLPLYVYLPAQRSSLYIFTHLNHINADQIRPDQTRTRQTTKTKSEQTMMKIF